MALSARARERSWRDPVTRMWTVEVSTITDARGNIISRGHTVSANSYGRAKAFFWKWFRGNYSGYWLTLEEVS